jgi:hypothetical protein
METYVDCRIFIEIFLGFQEISLCNGIRRPNAVFRKVCHLAQS